VREGKRNQGCPSSKKDKLLHHLVKQGNARKEIPDTPREKEWQKSENKKITSPRAPTVIDQGLRKKRKQDGKRQEERSLFREKEMSRIREKTKQLRY